MVRRLFCGMLAALAVLAPAARAVDEMPGQWGELGKNYITAGRSHKLLFRVTSLEYRVAPVVIGNSTYAPKADEKLLVVHFVLQNAEDTAYTVSWNALTMNAIDANEVTCKAGTSMGAEADGKSVGVELKPAQKIEVYRVIRVGAAGPAKKLIVFRDQPPVVRYDLLEKCKPTPLPKELADPADATGTTPAQPLIAKIGQKMPLGEVETTVDGWQQGQPTADGKAPKAGNQWVYVTATITNVSAKDQRLTHALVRPMLLSGEDQFKSRYALFAVDSDQVMTPPVLAPGASRTIRWALEVPATLNQPTLQIEWQTTDRKAKIALPTE